MRQFFMAAATVALIPVFILFVFLQRYFVEGVATSGLISRKNNVRGLILLKRIGPFYIMKISGKKDAGRKVPGTVY